MKKYKEAEEILKKLKGSRKILLSLHISPDPDSVGSNLAMYHTLPQLGKRNIEIISPDEPPEKLSFVPGFEKIKKEDIAEKDLSSFDLFISLDQAPVLMTRSSKSVAFPKKLSVIIIDHHATAKGREMAEVVLVDSTLGSTGELLYYLFKQWKIKFTEDIATCILTGIVGDTGAFRFPNTTPQTLKAAADLMVEGAPLSEITSELFFKNKYRVVKFWGRIVGAMKLEKVGDYNMVWAALPHSVIKEIGVSARESAASTFLQTIEESDFGLIMVEEEEGVIRGSLRSRGEVDVSRIADFLGGGGHKAASGFKVEIKDSFQETVKEVLDKIKEVVEDER